ncbi:MAG: hypothetical protein PHN35_01010 [Clostridia bacterium]|nr:hypothetical protein [Clostridia bacterium]MDD4798406.1 hypothetical protein [Clostridia bacterium]
MIKKIIIAFLVMLAALLLLGFFLHSELNNIYIYQHESGLLYEGKPIEQIMAEGKMTLLPDFTYSGDNFYEQLVYDVYSWREFNEKPSFFVLSARIFGRYEEADMMNVFATVYAVYYHLYGKILVKDKTVFEPVCVTFTKRSDGQYEYFYINRAKRGDGFNQSVYDFCLTPVTGRQLPDIAEQILNHYNNYGDLLELQRANLIEHLQKCEQKGVSLYLLNEGKPLLVPLT